MSRTQTVRAGHGGQTLIAALFIAAACAGPPASAVVIYVPADHPTIQQAIAAAVNGDEIIVAPGTYNEAINFHGKAIHLRSSDGPDVTTIDADGLNTSVVTCGSGEGPNTMLRGFTITGGNAAQGGGMFNEFSSPTIHDCVFTGNSASVGGAAFNVSGSEPTFNNCRFVGNTAINDGGAIQNSVASTSTFNGCTFAGNSANSGGAIWSSPFTFCSSHVSGSTFCENSPQDIFGSWHDQGGNEFLKECPPECVPADLNCDTVVDVLDMLILFAAWGPCADPEDCPADLNDDDEVDVLDMLILFANWG